MYNKSGNKKEGEHYEKSIGALFVAYAFVVALRLWKKRRVSAGGIVIGIAIAVGNSVKVAVAVVKDR